MSYVNWSATPAPLNVFIKCNRGNVLAREDSLGNMFFNDAGKEKLIIEYTILERRTETDLSAITSQCILAEAGETQVSRGVTYDSPKGERSMGKTVAMFNIHTGFNLTEEQGWQFMELLKMVRSGQGDFKLDNYVDGTSYASLAGESAARDRGNK